MMVQNWGYAESQFGKAEDDFELASEDYEIALTVGYYNAYDKYDDAKLYFEELVMLLMM